MTEITKEQERRLAKLDALEAGGVDNWGNYDFAMEELDKIIARDEAIETCLEEIEVALLEDVYEPSERGAGFCSTQKGRVEAERLLRDFLKTLSV